MFKSPEWLRCLASRQSLCVREEEEKKKEEEEEVFQEALRGLAQFGFRPPLTGNLSPPPPPIAPPTSSLSSVNHQTLSPASLHFPLHTSSSSAHILFISTPLVSFCPSSSTSSSALSGRPPLRSAAFQPLWRLKMPAHSCQVMDDSLKWDLKTRKEPPFTLSSLFSLLSLCLSD